MTAPRPRRLICVGFRRWKQYNLAPILRSQADELIFAPHAKAARRLAPTPADAIGWWSCEPPEGVAELAGTSGAMTIRIEDGFLRSVGLGSDLIPPLSLVLDRTGIYFDPRQPSDLETILATADFSEEELERARAVRAFIVEHGLTKYNLEPRQQPDWATQGRKVVLVTGQVEDDASIRFGCSDVRTNHGLLRAAREGDPDAYIIYKPHPDVMSGNRNGRMTLADARQWADHIETDLSVISCIEACDELHCMTSLAGFDALLRGKRVVTYGQPFYVGWGVTEDRATENKAEGQDALARRRRNLSLDELVAGTLIRYPLYWDTQTQRTTACQSVLRRIVEERDRLERSGALEKLRSGSVLRLKRKLLVLITACLSPR